MSLSSVRLILSDVDGVLTDSRYFQGTDGSVSLAFNVKDGHAIQELLAHDIEFGIISSSRHERLIRDRFGSLGVTRIYAGPQKKVEIASSWIQELGIDWREVAYVGDELIDLELLDKVGLPFCPADSHDSILVSRASVLRTSGGAGCLREIVSLLREESPLGWESRPKTAT